ncbi:MAG: RdgB/HAM1 family non-canonical purine NTP pyrophosphatase [Candidatus Eisenbacteria bacterium]|uniref:dITP/XTP pyrophosphatase n=1 Tax=Eiseniibacteriota bacterium TaxID=2212470 RepID=A0A538SL21_UNCEI|nr:MAG: RdgB/HAM1 family non-canonical purine NTP pyrophosphatase [Candidatus Eisenbacteria bacterium]
MKVVVASFNPDKLVELCSLLELPGLELVSLSEFPGAVPPDETGATLEENALLKARAALRSTGVPAIADDTGLEVEALSGGPGVRTARFAGPAATYDENVRHLLDLLRGVEPKHRTARFRTVCAACFPDRTEVVAEGVLEGRITERPRGSEGFGYDPVFEVAGTARTLAELEPAEKNQISHRAMAVRELRRRLAAPV